MDGIFSEHGTALEDEQCFPMRRLREVRGALSPALAHPPVFEGRGTDDGDTGVPDREKIGETVEFVLIGARVRFPVNFQADWPGRL